MTPSFAWRAAGQVARAAAAAALALLVALPTWAYFVSDPSAAARVLAAALALVTVASPASGLLACAGLLPLAGPIGWLTGSAIDSSFVEPLTLAFLAGYALRLFVFALRGAFRRTQSLAAAGRDLAVLPAALLALVVAASAIVGLFALQPGVDAPWPFARRALAFLYTGFFRSRGSFDVVIDAAYVLECLGLYAAALALVRRERRLAGRVIAMAACGGAGVAALNIARLATVWQRSGGGGDALATQLLTIRTSAAFGDLNAGGSYLAMALLLSAGLALATWQRRDGGGASGGEVTRRVAWSAVAVVIAAGLWLTGSRTALAAVLPALLVLYPVRPPISRRALWSLTAAIVCALLVTAALGWQRFTATEGDPRTLPMAFGFRVEMARAAGAMFAEHPVFGLGIGRFYPESGAYISERFRQLVPRENAHNNFLQVLAELGLVGFVPFLALLLVPAARLVQFGRRGRPPGAVVGAAAGLAAFVLTWFAGHPLLIFEVAASFWILLGTVTAALAWRQDEPASAPAPSRRSAAAAAACGALALSVIASAPVRGLAERPRWNLQSIAIGLSAWEPGENGTRFRTLEGERGQFYVPADTTSMRLPLRLAPSQAAGDAVSLHLSIDGVLVSRVRVEATEWRDESVVMPKSAPLRPFRTIEVNVGERRAGADGNQPRVQLGAPTITRAAR